jgi:hypothetical protein
MSGRLELERKFSDIRSDLAKASTGTGNVESLLRDLVDIVADSATRTTHIEA